MRLRVEPPFEQWRVARRWGAIATGHQAWLWHPGILAKYLAAAAVARDRNLRAVNLVVDHDVYNPLKLDVPVRRNGKLTVRHVQLATYNAIEPVGSQPPVDAHAVRATLAKVVPDAAVSLDRLIDAWQPDASDRTLADQLTSVLERLMRPLAGTFERLSATELMRRDASREIVESMLRDARACVAAYNRAAIAVPEAGIAPLADSIDRVELPLWAVAMGHPRRRVYADLADRKPLLALDDGSPFDERTHALAPRALLLSALIRSIGCDLFIHGTGGGVYDRVTDQWWSSWRGEPLTPRAVVTADLNLDLDAPQATPADLDRAVWYAHWLPHNVDRALNLAEARAQKAALLRQMDADRDPDRRRGVFEALRRFNAELVRAHPEALEEAHRRVERARVGLANARVLRRRDWCFALYPEPQLRALAEAVNTGAQRTGVQ